MFFLVQTIEIISTNKLHPNFKPRVIGKILLYRDYEQNMLMKIYWWVHLILPKFDYFAETQ